MRKIEREMRQAVANRQTWRNGNTSVCLHFYGEEFGNEWHPNVFLHDNHIATIKNGQCVVNVETLRRWPSVTTKSRLRALGANITTKNGITYLDGVAV